MKIVLVKGISQYGAMRNYIDQWEHYCRKMGHVTYVYDAMSDRLLEHLESVFVEMQPDLVLSCNAIYAESIEGILPEGCRYCTVLYDNPVVHLERLSCLGDRSIVFSCDRFYAEFIQEHYPELHKVVFLPLSGNCTKHQVPYRQRGISLLFTGTYFDLNQHYAAIKQLPETMQIMAENVIDIMLQEPDMLLWQALDQTLSDNDVDMQPNVWMQILSILRCVDIFVRAYVRDQVMLHIVDAGIPVHIYGNGWERFRCSQPKNLILHQGDSEVSLQALANTKISLNVMPWFRGGIQERNVAAMLSGAVSLTDSSRYIEQHFTDDVDIKLYSLKQLDQIPLLIQALLENDDIAAEIAMRGQQKVLSGHTWEHRVADMLQQIMEEP